MRKMVAALACRVQGSRLYGKPLQYLDIANRITLLDYMVMTMKHFPCIQDIVLGISEGIENTPFVEAAKKHGIDYIWGDQKDVLQRLIQCGDKAKGTDIFRVTTESPFIYYEGINQAWERHLEDGNDMTVIDGLPEGCFFEVITLDALKTSWAKGEDQDRSEMCSRYIRYHRSEFKVGVLESPPEVSRLDLRLTVDYPEDLYLCRKVYEALKAKAPLIPVADIVNYLDKNPEVREIVRPYVYPEKLYS